MEWETVVDSLERLHEHLSEGTEKDEKITCQTNRFKTQTWIRDRPKTKKVKVTVVSIHPTKPYEGVELYLLALFITSALDGIQ